MFPKAGLESQSPRSAQTWITSECVALLGCLCCVFRCQLLLQVCLLRGTLFLPSARKIGPSSRERWLLACIIETHAIMRRKKGGKFPGEVDSCALFANSVSKCELRWQSLSVFLLYVLMCPKASKH